jgi:allantoinase
MPGGNLLLRGQRILVDNELRPTAVFVEDGVIKDIMSPGAIPKDISRFLDIVDTGDSLVLPGGVDIHTHINEPGRTDWEGFESGTKAAAAGGMTTLGVMPLNADPVTTTADAYDVKAKSAQSKLWADVALYGGVVDNNLGDLGALADKGILAAKAFL